MTNTATARWVGQAVTGCKRKPEHVISARNMNKLEINVSSLAEVDPELLAGKVNLLEEFRTSKLTRTQFEKILTRAVNGTSLKTLYLKWPFAENNVFRNLCTTPIEDINEGLISEARKVIPFVDF